MPLKYLYEVGFIFRGFIILSHDFKVLPTKATEKKDLRGAFISAINTFAETAFNNNSLEYLDSGHILFIFKISKIKSRDYRKEEPIIMYGLVDKTKKNPDKVVRKFMEKSELIFQKFIHQFYDSDFTNLSTFESFENELKDYFL